MCTGEIYSCFHISRTLASATLQILDDALDRYVLNVETHELGLNDLTADENELSSGLINR